MGRALLTPDELRRFDNDYCIIFEKGLKPIKARKYYYFEYPTAKYASMYPMNHNDVEVPNRGVWRKYNPYNPYEEGEQEIGNDSIETLDELFDESEQQPKESVETDKISKNVQNIAGPNISALADETQDELDIQKQLEEKFDELFGDIEFEALNKKNS